MQQHTNPQEHIRIVRGRRLQTPVVSLRHPESGRRITLVAVMHAGQPDYYTQLGQLIAGLEAGGALVLAEGSSGPFNATELTEEQRAKLEHAMLGLQEQMLAFAALGWTGQARGMPHQPTWQVVGPSVTEEFGLSPDAMRGYAGNPAVRFVGRHPNVFHLSTAIAMRAIPHYPVDKSITPQAVFAAHTRAALDATYATDRDVVLLWGAKHLPPMIDDLTGGGYQPSGEASWYTVLRIPSITATLGRILLRRRPRDLTLTVFNKDPRELAEEFREKVRRVVRGELTVDPRTGEPVRAGQPAEAPTP